MKASIEIQNLKCGGCETTVKNSLLKLESVRDISIDVMAGIVSFSYSDSDTIDQARKTLSDLGYPPIDESNAFLKKAKSYVSCAKGRFVS